MSVSKDAVPGSSFPGAFPPLLLPHWMLLALVPPLAALSSSVPPMALLTRLGFVGFCSFTTFYFRRTGLQSTTSTQKQNQTSTSLQRKCQTHSLAHSTPRHSVLKQQSWRQQLLKQTGSLTPGATKIPRSYAGDGSKDDTLQCI